MIAVPLAGMPAVASKSVVAVVDTAFGMGVAFGTENKIQIKCEY